MKSGAQPIAKIGGFRFYSLIGAAFMLFAALPLMGQTALEKGEKLFWQTAEPVYVPDHLRLSWADAQAAAIVTRMNDEELLSQILMLGYPGKDAPPELLSWIAKRGLGGIKV